ncbi:helix-turn-helix domain-containing protein [Falsiroseomonas sp. HW251]|uniref:helix-turn-helix domain-containing protein n=1 Tax=Falsiroseomonas sp. HW251 TaxID=3390998 RepID=UPI003D31C837
MPAPVQSVRFTEPAAVLDATPGVVLQITPLRHDGFYVEQTTIRLGDLVLVLGACSPLAMIAVPGSRTVALQFPLDKVETLVLNGSTLPRFGFCLYGPGAELVRSNMQDNTYAVLVMPPEVADRHLGGDAGSPVVAPGEYVLRVAQPDSWHRMASLLRSASGMAEAAPEVFSSDPAREALRASLLGLARDLMREAKGTVRGRRRRTCDAWRRVVLGAESYLNAHLERPIYTEELCRALSVSTHTLMEAFHGTLGVSPHRYLKLRRLNLVRAALMRQDGGPQLVKSIALSHGFWHLGQFSHDYREHFGETPSETLFAAASNEHAPAALAAAQRAGRTT